MFKPRKALIALGLTALLIVPPVTAQASVAFRNFYDSRLPAAQQGVDVINDTKDTTGKGAISFSSIGASYKVNARLCKVWYTDTDTRTCGTELQNLGTGRSYDLANNGSSPLKKGDNARLQLHNSTWAVVTVSVTGIGRTN